MKLAALLSCGLLTVGLASACSSSGGDQASAPSAAPASSSEFSTANGMTPAGNGTPSPTGSASPSTEATAAPTEALDAADVARIRKALAAKGYKVTDAGPELTAAIKSFQRDNGLAATGRADASFWEAMVGPAPGAGSGASMADAGTASTAGPSSAAPGSTGSVAASDVVASGPTTDSATCSALFKQWDAAVLSGAKGSRAQAEAAHDAAAAAGCSPNKWLPSTVTKVFTPGVHQQGASCGMDEIAHYDAQGLVCTQDVTDHPHWN